ncbi:MAG: polysulfide reductase NrfD, partial [Nitrospinota bacterium]|nr:polysulfide reductase NrfD [Nitrospinota bacterium]
MIYTEFSFPNDSHIIWSLMIVTYPFISGVMAGAFSIAALYFVFGMESLKPVSRFSLLVSFSFLVCATLPLLNHLGHPE